MALKSLKTCSMHTNLDPGTGILEKARRTEIVVHFLENLEFDDLAQIWLICNVHL